MRSSKTAPDHRITRAVAAIELNCSKAVLGNLHARRDWGHARDYVEGMWRIVQQEEGDDFVLATGNTHTVRRFAELAFAHIDRKIAWSGTGTDEKGRNERTGEVLIEMDPRYFRPTEVDLLVGDPAKARAKLGWTHTVELEELVREMVQSDLMQVALEQTLHAPD